jgi:hypothetical protein
MQPTVTDPAISSSTNYSPNVETFYSANQPYFALHGTGAENWYQYPARNGQVELTVDGSNNIINAPLGFLEYKGKAVSADWYVHPALDGAVQMDVSGAGTQVLAGVGIIGAPFQTDLRWNNTSILPSNWYQYPTQNGIVTFVDASGNHILHSIEGNLYFDGELLALAGDVQDIAAWSDYPAIHNILMEGFSIQGANDITTETLEASVLNTTLLSAATVEAIIETNTASLNVGPLALGGQTIQTSIRDGNIRTTGDISGETLHIHGIATARELNLDASGGTAPVRLTTNLGGTELFVNGSVVQTGSPSDASQWAAYPAVANVDVNTHNLSMTGSLVPPATNTFSLGGSTVTPILRNEQYALQTDIYSVSPVNTLNISSNAGISLLSTSSTGSNEFNISLVGAAGENMNLTAPDINLTMTDTTSFMNLTAPFGVTILGGGGFFMAAGAMEVVTGLDIMLVTPGNIRIGSGNVGGATTEIEKYSFLDNVVTPVSGANPFVINRVRTLNNSIGSEGGDGVMNFTCVSVESHTVQNFTDNSKTIGMTITASGSGGVDNRNITMGNFGTNTDKPFVLNFANMGNGMSMTYMNGKLLTFGSSGGPMQFAGLSEIDLIQNGGTGTCALTTSTDGLQLLVNGVPVGAGSAALWATYPATTNVDISGHNITNAADVSGASGHFGSLYTSSDQIHLGSGAGGTGQGTAAFAIGNQAGATSQGNAAIALGSNAGRASQGINGIAIGLSAASVSQGAGSIAIGELAGITTQGTEAVAIGNFAGSDSQGNESIAIGHNAGGAGQGANSIAIGSGAAQGALGAGSIYIGSVLSSGEIHATGANTIMLNGSGVALPSATNSNACYITPVAQTAAATGYQTSMLRWNNTTKEMTYAPQVGSLQVVATSATAIALSPLAYGKTYILTGTTTQPFTTATFTTNDAGWFCIVHNGNAQGGGDINITGATGTTIIHNRTSTANGGNLYLVWNGTGLVGY